MLPIVMILAWLVALGLAFYLATRSIKHRIAGRRRTRQALKKVREFRKHHHFDQKQGYWVRDKDRVALIDESVEDHRFTLAALAWLLFILWEGFWLLEIRERYVASHRFDLPYAFLFVVLVAVPFALYLLIRRKRRRLRMRPPDRLR
jgi:Flp pilus assembly protein TadB